MKKSECERNMTNTIKWYAALSVMFGVLTLSYLPCVGLAVVFSCFTVAAVILRRLAPARRRSAPVRLGEWPFNPLILRRNN